MRPRASLLACALLQRRRVAVSSSVSSDGGSPWLMILVLWVLPVAQQSSEFEQGVLRLGPFLVGQGPAVAFFDALARGAFQSVKFVVCHCLIASRRSSASVTIVESWTLAGSLSWRCVTAPSTSLRTAMM